MCRVTRIAKQRSGDHALAPDGEPVECLAWFGSIANREVVHRRLCVRDPLDDGALAARAYQVLGVSAWSLVEGQFALLLQDHRCHELVAVTDPVGSVGIHYREDADALSFSFDIESLLHDRPPDASRINADSVVLLLCGLGPMPGETYFSDIRRIAPATCAIFGPAGMQARRYWHPLDVETSRIATSEIDAAFASVLTEVCEGYADGATPSILLSGGLDSAVVAWALGRGSGKKPVALSTRPIDHRDQDEVKCAQTSARHLGLTSITIDYPAASLFDPERRLCFGPGYPVYAHHLLNARIHQVARSRGFDTLFTGDGGDHLFCKPECAIADNLVRGRWRTAYRDAHALATRTQRPARIPLLSALRLVLRAGRPLVRAAHCAPVSVATTSMKRRARQLCASRQVNPSRRCLPGRWQHRARLLNPNLDFLLQARTGLSLATRVAYRYPLLDRRIQSLVAAMTTEQLAGGGQSKRLFRDALQDHLPGTVTGRPKALFNNHFSRALRRHPERIRALTRDTRMADAGWIDARGYQSAVDDWLQHPQAPMPPHFLGLLTIEDWLRRYF